MNRVEEVYDVLNKIKMPEGQDLVVLKYEKGENKGKYVTNLDHKQQVLLSQLISKAVFPSGEWRYTLLPLEKFYNIVHSKSEDAKIFKELNKTDIYWLWNREVILKERRIIPDPMVCEKEGKLFYVGESIEAKISTENNTENAENIYNILRKAGLFSEQKDLEYGGIVLFENGESAVRSRWWTVDGDCFSASAYKPAYKDSWCIVVFGKTNEKVEI